MEVLEIIAEKGELRGELRIEVEAALPVGGLTIEVVDGEVIPGETITLLVTFEGEPVPGALVKVNDDEVGQTDEDGLISFTVPEVEVLEIVVEKGELRGELRIEVEEE